MGGALGVPSGATAAVVAAVGGEIVRASMTAVGDDARIDGSTATDGFAVARPATLGAGDTGRADGRAVGATVRTGGVAAAVATASAAGIGGGAAGVTSADSAPRERVAGAVTVTTGEREPRPRTSVTTSAALAPRTPIKSQSHQRRLRAKNAGRRRRVAGEPRTRAFSLSARLSAS